MTPSDLAAIRERADHQRAEDYEGSLADACADRASLLAHIEELEQRTTATPKPQRGGLAAIIGKWPGDETDEEIEEGLAALEDPTRHIACGLAFDHGRLTEDHRRLLEEAAGLWEAQHAGCDSCCLTLPPLLACPTNPYRGQP